MMIKNAIFDMDGTLVESMKFWRIAEMKAVEEIHGYKFSDEQFSMILPLKYYEAQDVMSKIVGKNIGGKQTDDRAFEIIRKYYEGDEINIKSYATEYLKYLKEKGCGVAVATATPKDMAVKHLEKQGLLQYIDYVFTEQEDSKIGKSSSSKLYDIAMSALNGTKDDTVIFEDAIWCIKTAVKSGYYTIGVADDVQRPYFDEIKKTVNLFIESYKEMMI